MKRKFHSFRYLATLWVVAGLVATQAAPAQQPADRYAHMAPLAHYLIPDRAQEVALAKSAAPAAISDHATVQVLDAHGYVTVVEGTNGFVCLVERGWLSPFDAAEFWNPKLRGPICYNRESAKSILPITYKRTALALAGQSKEQIKKAMEAALAAHQLPPLEPGGMSYMMSKQGFLNDQAGHWIPHLMFYTATNVDWGADQAGSPVMLNPQFHGVPEPINVLMIPAGKWSDGTAAPNM